MDTHGFTARMRPFVARIVDEIGPRPAGSDAERGLGSLLETEWAGFCDQVDVHAFDFHPRAFLGWIPWMVAVYLVALASYWFFPPLAFLLSAMAVLVIYVQGIRFRELLDRLFPAARGHNVIGVLKPRAAIKRRAVLVAHQDSAYEFTLWYRFRKLSPALMVVFGLAFAWMAFAGLAASLGWVLGGTGHVAFTVMGIVGAALYPIVGLFVFFTAWQPVPGALDNASGIAVIDALGRALARGGPEGQRMLDSTEVVLLAASSEEAGLRGSRRFVGRHRARLERTPTYVLNLDGIGQAEHLSIITRELWTGARHDRDLVELALAAGQQHGLAPKQVKLLMGGTDAAPFSLAAIPALTIICQDSSQLIPNYHTRHDTIDHVEQAALGAAFTLSLATRGRLDTAALELAGEAEPGWGGGLEEDEG